MREKILKLIRVLFGIMFFICIFLCICIEYKQLLIPCSSDTIAKATNNIILAISYSIIAATIFHVWVNVIPKYQRRKIIEPLLNYLLLSISEDIRLSKDSIIPFTAISNEKLRKTDYTKKFNNSNLHEDSIIKGKSKLEYLNDLRESIKKTSYILLSYRDYLNNKQFQYINFLLQSPFISQGIHPYPNIELEQRTEYYGSNQHEIGESIYDLYEYSKQRTK